MVQHIEILIPHSRRCYIAKWIENGLQISFDFYKDPSNRIIAVDCWLWCNVYKRSKKLASSHLLHFEATHQLAISTSQFVAKSRMGWSILMYSDTSAASAWDAIVCRAGPAVFCRIVVCCYRSFDFLNFLCFTKLALYVEISNLKTPLLLRNPP